MRINRNFIIIVILFIIMILSNIIAIMTFMDYKNNIPKQINSIVVEEVTKNIKSIIPKDGINGYTPVKGVDYFDGSKGDKGDAGQSIKGNNGTNGANGLSAYEIATSKGFIGTEDEWLESLKPIVNDGLTPIIRCNVSRNRWEVRYTEYDIWNTIKNEYNKQVPCIIKE